MALVFMGVVVLGIGAFAVVTESSHSNPTQALTPAPSLATLLGTPPGRGFVPDPARTTGYLDQAQLGQTLPGLSLPAGVRFYQASWIQPATRYGVIELGVSAPNVAGAEEFAAGAYHVWIQKGEHPLAIRGLPGSVLTTTSTVSGSVHPIMAAVARSNTAIVFGVYGPTMSGAEETVSETVNTVGGSLPLDVIPSA